MNFNFDIVPELVKLLREFLHDSTQRKRQVAIQKKKESACIKKQNKTGTKHIYYCSCCKTSIDIYTCDKCDLGLEACICEDPSMNHYARHVAKMCRSCFDDISKHDTEYLEIMKGLKELPSYFIFLRIVMDKLLTLTPDSEADDIDRRENCKVSWDRLKQYMVNCSSNLNEDNQEYQDVRDQLHVSKAIKSFVFGEKLTMSEYRPVTSEHIKQTEALLSDEDARMSASFFSKNKKRQFAKKNTCVEVLIFGNWELAKVVDINIQQKSYKVVLENKAIQINTWIPAHQVRILSLSNYVSRFAQEFNFKSHSKMNMEQLYGFFLKKMNSKEFNAKAFLEELHDINNPLCMVLMMVSLMVGVNMEGNENGTFNLWDAQNFEKTKYRLNYDCHDSDNSDEKLDIFKTIDILTITYGLLFLVPSFSSDVLSQFMYEPLLRVLRYEVDDPLAKKSAQKTSTWCNPVNITNDPRTILNMFTNNNTPCLELSDLPYTYIMAIFDQVDFFKNLHIATRYHASRFTMSSPEGSSKKKRSKELMNMLVHMQLMECEPGNMIDHYQKDIRATKFKLTTIYKLFSCFHNNNPIPKDLQKNILKILLDTTEQDFKNKLLSLPQVLKDQAKARKKLKYTSKVSSIRGKHFCNYQNNILIKLNDAHTSTRMTTKQDLPETSSSSSSTSSSSMASKETNEANNLKGTELFYEDDNSYESEHEDDDMDEDEYNKLMDENECNELVDDVDCVHNPQDDLQDSHGAVSSLPQAEAFAVKTHPSPIDPNNHENPDNEEYLNDIATQLHTDFVPLSQPCLSKRPPTPQVDINILKQELQHPTSKVCLNNHDYIQTAQQKAKIEFAKKQKDKKKALKHSNKRPSSSMTNTTNIVPLHKKSKKELLRFLKKHHPKKYQELKKISKQNQKTKATSKL